MEGSIPPVSINVKQGASWNTSKSISDGFMITSSQTFEVDGNEDKIIVSVAHTSGDVTNYCIAHQVLNNPEVYSEFEKVYMKYLMWDENAQ